MAIPGVTLVRKEPGPTVQTGRADVALFAGLIARTAAPLPQGLRSWLGAEGWLPIAVPAGGDSAEAQALLGLPVPVESWEEFSRLYRWDDRPVEAGSPMRLPSNMGLAVRSFFTEGGRKAYIVRTGDPLELVDANSDPAQLALAKRRVLDPQGRNRLGDAGKARLPLVPGWLEPRNTPDPGERGTWMGAAAIMGIEDAAMLILPDLVELCAGQPEPVAPALAVPGGEERFRPCAPVLPAALPDERVARPALRAPRLAPEQFAQWAQIIGYLIDLLGRPRGPSHRRDVMLVGAMPLPLASAGLDHGEESNPLLLLGESGAVIAGQKLFSQEQIGSARLQLAYPWIGTEASRLCPEGVQSPDGMLAGMIARTVLAKGAFHSAAGQEPFSVTATVPALELSDLRNSCEGSSWLGERLCLTGMRNGRLALLSDVTMADSRAWRSGGVSRLMAAILRAARTMSQDHLFEPAGPELWSRLGREMESFLRGLEERGALTSHRGAPPFEVRCDRSTMTQTDIDSGRVIMEVGFTAAYPLEHLEISLNLVEPPRLPTAVAA